MPVYAAIRSLVIVSIAVHMAVVPAQAQQISNGSSALPNVIDEEDRLEITATSAAAAPRIDGMLDDAVWSRTTPITGFIQSEPDEGHAATQRTEVRVAYDASFIYIAAYCYDDEPERIVVADIRRDFRLDNQDAFEVILDTFTDRRNGYVFATNPAGARADQQVTNEGREINTSWDAPWSVSTQRVSDGWTLEMAIPLNSIRSADDAGQAWGINFSRRIRRNNEVVYWAPIPRSYALTRLSLAGNLTNLGTVKGGRDLRATPYVAGRTVREVGGPAFDENADVGIDVKYGLTNGLTLDLTVNPDFAQAEADVQRVNLTQFSQFFPEKRDFFLENSGLFYIGDVARNTRISTAPRGNEDMVMFHSRRMGLASGRAVPIDGGLRLTGREGGVEVGALALRSRDLEITTGSVIPSNDYGVVRLRRNIFSNSDVGGIFMTRSGVDDRGDYNRVYGVDANIRLPARIDWSSYVVNSESPGVSGARYAYQTSFNREANFLHVKFGLLSIGENFTNDLGFFRRTGIMRWSLDTGIRPRYASLRKRGVREMHPHVVWNYYTDQSGKEVAKRLHTGYTIFFSDGGVGQLAANPSTETITSPFQIHPDVQPFEPGRYDWTHWQLTYSSDPSRLVFVNLGLTVGGLWTGTQQSIRTTLTVTPSYQFRTSLGVARTSGDMAGPGGKFVREIWTARANYSFTTNMFVDALTQYDADRKLFNANVRFNLIHHPLSDLFIVYNEQRFTTVGGPAPGRSIIIKLTQMFSY